MGIPSNVLELLLPLVKRFEGCPLVAYKKGDGVWTIGYGHTGLDVVNGLVWTQEQADTQLLVDISAHYSQLIQDSPNLAGETDGRQAALTDFVYNLGIGTYRHSTLRSAAIVGAWGNVKNQLMLWVHSGGIVLPGLVKRRQAECELIDS
jgi:lysozyme